MQDTQSKLKISPSQHGFRNPTSQSSGAHNCLNRLPKNALAGMAIYKVRQYP
jgi:hypothetical protein